MIGHQHPDDIGARHHLAPALGKALAADRFDLHHELPLLDAVRVVLRVGVVAADDGPDFLVALPAQEHAAQRRACHGSENTDLCRKQHALARDHDVDVLHVRSVLQAQQHGFAGRLSDRIHDVGDGAAFEQALLDPASEYGHPNRRPEFSGLRRVVEVAEIEQALEQHGGARLRQLECAGDLADGGSALLLPEILQDGQSPLGGFDGRPGRCC